MNTKTIALVCAAAFCGAAFADEEKTDGWAYNPGEGVSFNEQPIVAAEFGLQLDSRYMTYGVIDGRDPILTPSAQLTYFDWLYTGIETIYDLSKYNGRVGDYGNRSCAWTTIDAIGGLAHEFEIADGVALSVDFNYIYEYFYRSRGSMADTQYLNLELGLSGFWIEPTLWIERDLMADNGTYANLALAHPFVLVGDEDDPTLTFTPSIGQGIGDKHRTRGYELARDHGGLMDTTVKGEFEWKVCANVALTAYAAYSDYLFDNKLRRGAREYNAAWGSGCDHSWNFYGGIGITVSF